MKRLNILLAVLVLLTAAGTANADNTLLFTKLLEPGQFDLQASYDYLNTNRNLDGGKVWTNTFDSTYDLGVGLLRGWELRLSVPYVFSDRSHTNSSILNDAQRGTSYTKVDGVGDVTLGTRISIVGSQRSALLVDVGADVKLDSAGMSNAGSGTTDVSPVIVASYQVGNLIPYGSYRAILRNNNANDSHIVTAGAEWDVTKDVSFDLNGSYSYNTSAGLNSDFEGFAAQLSAYLQVAKNFYLIPSARMQFETPRYISFGQVGGVVHYGHSEGYGGGLAIYYMYE